MSIVYSIEVEQDLADTYLRRWKEILHLGDWWIECSVKAKGEFPTKKDDAIVYIQDLSRSAKIFVRSRPERKGYRSFEEWENNLELLVLHEICHILLFDLRPDTFTKEMADEEEKMCNKLSMIFYSQYHHTDPTKEAVNA